MVDFDKPVSFFSLFPGNVFEYNDDLHIVTDKHRTFRLSDGVQVNYIAGEVVRKEVAFRGTITDQFMAGKLDIGELFQHDAKLYMKVKPNMSVHLEDGTEVAITQDMYIFELVGECQVRLRIPLDKLITNNESQRRLSVLSDRPDFLADIKERDVQHALKVRHIDGRYVIVDGHFRYEAAKQLGFASIPCEILPEVNFDYIP